MLLLMAMTLVVMACTGVEDMAGTPEQERSAQQLPVAFSAYVNRSTTRGGATGQLTTDGTGGTTSLRTEGFGVFGYYTGTAGYSQAALPNFMYNQKVTYNSTNWEYSPVKYWPNGEGEATGTQNHYLTFFAYAPYVDVNSMGRIDDAPATTEIDESTTGITALTRVGDCGDPMVSYHVNFNPDQQVDLCWAMPREDLTKPSIADRVAFDFQHALAALNVQIDADVDVTSHATNDTKDGYTRIWVRSITFEGFATKGKLNLNNSASIPHWYGLGCDCDLTSTPITIYDGRSNRHEGIAQALNERPTGLNPELVQSDPYTVNPEAVPPTPTFSSTTLGVTTSLVNLFSSSAIDAPIYVIPTNDPLRVTIVYDVETYDPKLTSQYLSDGRTHGSTIENSISAYITNGTTPIVMEAGKQYTLNLHLGVASVKMNASVTPWADDIGNVDVNVPE